ncbi:hypothetical protein EON82_16795 [bacterium]|nr:MAG: hypothetical protein EON82_16795 [bacterium]
MEPTRKAMATLLREAFYGRPEGKDSTWFVEGREAILPTLDEVDAMTASHSPASGVFTLAAHAYHLRYILHWCNTSEGDPRPEGDWESTWAKQVVTDEEWNDLRAEIKERFERAVGWLERDGQLEDEDADLMLLSVLPHVAYHLGAMRVILTLLKNLA